jgi:hypothetical protein
VLPLLEGTTLKGEVVDGEGKPIAGASIEILPYGLVLPQGTETDKDGRFSSLLAEGSWKIKASKAGKSETWASIEIPAGQATASLTITAKDSASLLVETDCKGEGCLSADASVSIANSGFTQYLDDSGATVFRGLPAGDAVITVRNDEDPRRPALGEAKVKLSPGAAARVSVTLKKLDASATVEGVLIEENGKPAKKRPGTQLVVDVIFLNNFRRRVVANDDGSFAAADIVPGECELLGMRIDPKDPLSGSNFGRIPFKITAPATGVKVKVIDRTR